MRAALQFLLLFLFQCSLIECANILGIFVFNSKSHHSINQSILRRLAARGHNVTVISNFHSNSTIENFTELLIGDGLPSYVDSISMDKAIAEHVGLWAYIYGASVAENGACLKVLNLDYVKRLIRNSDVKEIDVLFIETYHTQCYTMLAHKLDVPVIAISPPWVNPGLDYVIGNPFNPSHVPMLASEFTTKMDFFQRLINVSLYIIIHWYQIFILNANMANISKTCLHMEMPSEDILNKRVALGFYNTHFTIFGRPQVPNAIDIGGIHIEQANALSEELTEFIEGAKDGVILFSFGSAIKANSIHPEKLKTMLQVFSKIPQRILWRMDALGKENILPQNIKILKWLPQRDILDNVSAGIVLIPIILYSLSPYILEHKNVVAFISHCGLFGILEAIYTETPVIAMPLMFDEFQIANVLVEHKVAIYVDYNFLNDNTLHEAINEIINNTKYKKNMKRLSVAFKDRPIPPSDSAIYWFEYIIRYKGAPWLRTPAADMPLYQFLLLDVIAVVLIIVVFSICVPIFLVKKIISVLVHKEKKNY